MNREETSVNRQRKEKEDFQFKIRITEIIKRIENSILKIVEACPSEAFTNEFIDQMSNTNYFKKATALCHAFVKIPDIERLVFKYPDEFMELEQAIKECMDLSTIHFLSDDAKNVSNELVSTPIYVN
ncbi:MAG: hypothetical protein GZ094_01225 [Mariniphaga sp.]|nr:hypothetical protein [Mariniphaga sp.]